MEELMSDYMISRRMIKENPSKVISLLRDHGYSVETQFLLQDHNIPDHRWKAFIDDRVEGHKTVIKKSRSMLRHGYPSLRWENTCRIHEREGALRAIALHTQFLGVNA